MRRAISAWNRSSSFSARWSNSPTYWIAMELDSDSESWSVLGTQAGRGFSCLTKLEYSSARALTRLSATLKKNSLLLASRNVLKTRLISSGRRGGSQSLSQRTKTIWHISYSKQLLSKKTWSFWNLYQSSIENFWFKNRMNPVQNINFSTNWWRASSRGRIRFNARCIDSQRAFKTYFQILIEAIQLTSNEWFPGTYSVWNHIQK